MRICEAAPRLERVEHLRLEGGKLGRVGGIRTTLSR